MTKGERSRKRNIGKVQNESNLRYTNQYAEYEGRPLQELAEEVIDQYRNGALDNEEAVLKAEKILAAARKTMAGNNRFDLYYAAVGVLAGSYENNVVDRGKKTYMSLAMLDRSIEREDSIEARTIRANICLNIPTYFNRIATAIGDFEFLKEKYESDPGGETQQEYKRIINNLERAYEIQKSIPPHVQKLMDGFSSRYKRSKKP